MAPMAKSILTPNASDQTMTQQQNEGKICNEGLKTTERIPNPLKWWEIPIANPLPSGILINTTIDINKTQHSQKNVASPLPNEGKNCNKGLKTTEGRAVPLILTERPTDDLLPLRIFRNKIGRAHV